MLDLKMSAEVKSYTELPMDVERSVELVSSGNISSTPTNASQETHTVKGEESYAPFEDHTEESETDAETLPAEEVIDIGDYKSAIAEAVEEQSSGPNYEAMSLKELQALAKSRNIVGVTKKGPLIEALKTSDRSSPVKPSAINAVGSNSFLETSAPVSDETA